VARPATGHAALIRLVLLNGDVMTAVPDRRAWGDRLGRYLLPTYGARANAADSLGDLRRLRQEQVEARRAVERGAPARTDGSGEGTRR
jgi:hypothetical protein